MVPSQTKNSDNWRCTLGSISAAVSLFSGEERGLIPHKAAGNRA